MPLYWDDDEEEELTEVEYRKRPSRVVIHDEVTSPTNDAPSQHRVPKPSPPPVQPPPVYRPPQEIPSRSLGLLPASPRDRFVAFALDTLLGLYLYWVVGYGLNLFFGTQNIQLLHENTGRLAIHIALTLGLFFFYYLLMESVFGATLGKLFCRLRVVEVSGRRPSLGNVFIRNFLRLVDYPLAFLIAVITMESSPLNQRLGDRAGGTVVIKKTRRYLSIVDLKHTPLASTLSRIFAELVDLLLSLTLVYSLILLMTPDRPFLSYLLYISTPVAFIAYYTILEFLFGTTPGKALFRRQVVMDNGEPPDGTSAFIRNFFRPLDYILGYPLMVLSKRKQRLGDMAADTLVVSKAPSKPHFLGSAAGVVVVLIVAYFGFSNPNNFIRKDYGLGPVEGLKIFIPKFRTQLRTKRGKSPQSQTPPVNEKVQTPQTEPSELPQSTSDKLKLAEFYFATGPEPSQIRHDRKFRQGDLIYLFFKLEGFQVNSKKSASLSEDLKVEGPNGNVVLAKPQVVNLRKTIESNTKAILFANNIKLPKNSPKGSYRVIITVYDKVAKTEFSFDRKFTMQ